jgi:hypothetical protein
MASNPSLRKRMIQNLANFPMKMRRSPILLEDVVIRILIQLRKQPVFQHGSIPFGRLCILRSMYVSFFEYNQASYILCLLSCNSVRNLLIFTLYINFAGCLKSSLHRNVSGTYFQKLNFLFITCFHHPQFTSV